MKKFITLLFTLALGVSVFAQDVTMKNASASATETITNTGTGILTAQVRGHKNTVTVQVTVTKTSGTVAGTLTLQGSLDNVNYKAALLPNGVSTAVNTYTATDVATQTFIWQLSDNPYNYWRVSYTGSGTMVATATAVLLAH